MRKLIVNLTTVSKYYKRNQKVTIIVEIIQDTHETRKFYSYILNLRVKVVRKDVNFNLYSI